MHDQVRVRVRDGRLHVEEQADRASTSRHSSSQCRSMCRPSTCSSTRYGWPVLDTPASIRRRDVRMREPREDRAFALEALSAGAADERGVEQLDRRLAFEAAVAALGQPDAAHAAVADGRDQRVGADRRRPRARAPAGASRPATREIPRPSTAGAPPAGPRRRPPARLSSARKRRQPGVAFGRRQVQDAIEMRAGALPALDVECAHSMSIRSEDRKRAAKADIRQRGVVPQGLVQVDPRFLPVALHRALRHGHASPQSRRRRSRRRT